MKYIKQFLPHVVALFGSAVFLDSIRFKFTNHPNTQEIFGRLDAWTNSFGVSGLFTQTGIFGPYAIGTAELIASALLLLGILPGLRVLQGYGALLAFAVMSGAVFFHLFTPLGIDPNNDGGGLFMVAIILWVGSGALAYYRLKDKFIKK